MVGYKSVLIYLNVMAIFRLTKYTEEKNRMDFTPETWELICNYCRAQITEVANHQPRSSDSQRDKRSKTTRGQASDG